MYSTIELLKLLGSPFAKASAPKLDTKTLKRLYLCARKNRISFFYLATVRENYAKTLNELYELYKEEDKKFLKTKKAIVKLSKTLEDGNISYTFFKTIRPYKSTTVDLDVLILKEYSSIFEIMHNAGYILIKRGPRSATFLDTEANIGIDLYEEVAASFIIYFDKQSLATCVINLSLSNNVNVQALNPEADLACIIAHSIIKEQMYTLSEYYSFIHYLKQININDFIQTIKQNNITSATRTHASLTALLHNVAHKTIPKELEEIVEALGEEKFETARLIQKNFETPHKYHPITVAKCLLEITKNKKTRNSIAMQIYQMLSPNFTKRFLAELIQHIKRETY
ncbi:MAG: hypothetical protein QXF61_03945 [Nitrososphaeria archaeon]